LLNNKVAIITGAGRGIGKAIAVVFARNGAEVILNSRTLSEVENTAEIIKSQGFNAMALSGDASNPEEVFKICNDVCSTYGRIDVLVNAAGVQGPIGPLVNNNINEWISTIHINLIGTVLFCKSVLPVMIKQQLGSIINFSGGGATSPRPNFSAYAASKGGVVHFSETLAAEVKPYNIKVNTIAPGAINTRMLSQIIEAGSLAGNEYSKALKQSTEGGTPVEKPVNLALFLASDKSKGITGKLISAVWDDWQSFPDNLDKLASSEIYTLRRVVQS
jgi:NAD(P)-dependent dehydrogenase (short-subunit alcohol dehydrogenase family)